MMFWKRDRGEKKKKEVMSLSGSALWSYMYRRHGLNGEALIPLRRVESDGMVDDKPVTMIRIFDPDTAKEKGVSIEDYQSLDNHPDLILHEGYYCEARGQIIDGEIEEKK
jgi:hypothetical protein